MRHARPAARLTGAILALLLATFPLAAFEYDRDSWFGAGPGARELEIVATADTELFVPIIEGFLAQRPGLRVRYVEAPSTEVYRAVAEARLPFDIVISSAMDLQMKLANDGHARAVAPEGAEWLPAWARWRNLLYSVAQEPAVVLLHESALEGDLAPPRSRRDLIDLLRGHPDRFKGRTGTYDPVSSGVGYMFATQDARVSDTFWRLAEVLGRLDVRLYCCSFEMLEDVRSGRILVAYNVIGSYAATRLRPDDPVRLVELQDYTLALLRTAIIPVHAADPELGIEFLSFLLSTRGRQLFAEAARLPPINATEFEAAPHLRPIQLDPGLLAALDQLMRRQFLEEWTAAMEQP